MCKGDGSILMKGDEDNILLLSQLKQADPEKFKRYLCNERNVKTIDLPNFKIVYMNYS
jgi:hypothetical protein